MCMATQCGAIQFMILSSTLSTAHGMVDMAGTATTATIHTTLTLGTMGGTTAGTTAGCTMTMLVETATSITVHAQHCKLDLG